MRNHIGFAFVLLALTVSCDARSEGADRPNVVVIMTDNHGAWTLGCYGNKDIRTPNIDRLAAQGTLFTRAFASNPVCSPTRATFLTGLMPSQHGVHCFLFGGRLQTGPEARCTLDELTSLPEILSNAGYACGLVGKWHLGGNMHPQEGFDDYWITTPHGGTSTFYGAQIIEDGKLRNEPEYLTDFWTRHAVNFIDQRVEEDKPFFLFLTYNGPYSLGRLLLRDGQNRHAAYYSDKELRSFPREKTHPWQFSNRDYHNNPTSIRRVATEVSGVDDGVGTVMDTLKKHGLDDNTIVIFLADQGWAGGQGGFFGMGDHTRPLTAQDDMMRIPLIWRHPGQVDAGVRSDRMVAGYDILPTLLAQLDLSDRMPQMSRSPGHNFSDALTAESKSNSNRPIFYEFENLRCIRTERFKYVHRHPNGPHELYDLENDSTEFDNLVDSPRFAVTRSELKRQLDEFFKEYAEPKYDMWNGGGSQTRTFLGISEELAQADSVAPPPVPHDFTPQTIKVPDGFTVDLAAGPPLVEHPTFASFDDRGRLFVSENAGVNMSAAELEEKLPNSVRLLEDTDGDGRFDSSKVFADNMTFPMGGAWHDGALYVASPPSIWRLEDTDNDGVADKRDVIVDKFGYTGNAASIHGCFFGPDGRLYWCDGFHGHEFKDEAGNVISKRSGSYIFSCKPDGSDVRLHCGGGMDNPVEVDFTDEGDVIGTVNILYTRPRVDCLVHWLYGGAYPHRERVLSELKVTGDFLDPVHRFGHVAVSGTTRYRSGVMDHRWRDNMFVTFFNSGKVVRVELEENGSTFAATQREFLSCASRDFHPTDVTEDADGSLLVVDTGGWFYRGCPTSQHSKPDIKGAIYRIRRTGMTTLPDPRGDHINWSKQTAPQLVNSLNDPRHQVREQATGECARRGAGIVPTLKQTIQRRDIRQRQNAVWALTRMVGNGTEKDTEAAREGIRLALNDRHASVRRIACRSLALYPDPAASDRLIELLKKDEPHVRRVAASALGRLGDARAVPSLLSALAVPQLDRSEEHAITYALIEINNPQATRLGLVADSSMTQRGALVALDQMDAGDLTAADVVALAMSDDRRLQQATGLVLGKHPEWSAHAADIIAELVDGPEAIAANRELVLRLSAVFLDEPDVGALFGEFLNDNNASRDTLLFALAAIAQKRGVALHPSWTTPLKELLDYDNPNIEAAIAAVAAIDTDVFRSELGSLSDHPFAHIFHRFAALQAFEGRHSDLSERGYSYITDVLHERPPYRQRAAQIIGTRSLTKPQLLQLAPELETAGPSQLRELVRPYQRSRDAEVGQAFLDAMASARSLSSLSPPEFSDIIKRYPAELLPQSNDLLNRLRQAEQDKLDRLDALIAQLKHGDADRGRELFFTKKSKCADCHRVGDRGRRVGPDLTTIGANRSAQDLLESVVFPSATIVRDYEPYTIVLKDGRSFSGLIESKGGTLIIRQQASDPVSIPLGQVEELVPTTVSIMPNGLEKALTEAELADVIAFLQSLGH